MHNQPQSILADSHRIVGCYGNHSAKSEEVLKFSKKKTGRVHLLGIRKTVFEK